MGVGLVTCVFLLMVVLCSLFTTRYRKGSSERTHEGDDSGSTYSPLIDATGNDDVEMKGKRRDGDDLMYRTPSPQPP